MAMNLTKLANAEYTLHDIMEHSTRTGLRSARDQADTTPRRATRPDGG